MYIVIENEWMKIRFLLKKKVNSSYIIVLINSAVINDHIQN